jgi:putative FmdB family regulatory protein
MPTYEYTCRDCGHTFEIVQSMLDEPLTMCPECGGSLRKVFAPPAISFKGSGFYATDHGKKAKRSESKSGADRSTGGDGDSSPDGSKGGSKDASKDEAKGSSEASSTSTKKEPAAS